MKKENAQVIAMLENKYAKDQEALEVIERAKADIEAIERKETEGGYKGQPSIGFVRELEAFLHDWY